MRNYLTVSKIASRLQRTDLLPVLVVDLLKGWRVIHLLDVCKLMADNMDQPAHGHESARRTSEDDLYDLASVPLDIDRY